MDYKKLRTHWKTQCEEIDIQSKYEELQEKLEDFHTKVRDSLYEETKKELMVLYKQSYDFMLNHGLELTLKNELMEVYAEERLKVLCRKVNENRDELDKGLNDINIDVALAVFEISILLKLMNGRNASFEDIIELLESY